MQVAVKDIRRWGYRKLSEQFFSSEEEKQNFLDLIRAQNIRLTDIKSSAYSLPRIYNKLSSNMTRYYWGMVRFVDFCEPMMPSIDKPDASIQRKFKNQWKSLWEGFCEEIDLLEDFKEDIMELGIRLCFYEDLSSVNKLDSSILDFYNAILSWYVITISESAIQELGLEPQQLIGYMIQKDSRSFLYSVINIDFS